MNEKILISYIIPAYNAADTLERAVESITHTCNMEKCEILIVENGSTDYTNSVALKLIQKYGENVKLIHSEKGVSRARNEGLKNARGEWIVFVDADDYIVSKSKKYIYEDILNAKADLYVYSYEIGNRATSVITYFSMFAQLGIPTYGIRACAKVRDNREKLSKVAQELLIINIIMSMISYMVLIILLFYVPKFRCEKELYVILSFNIILTSIGMEWLYKALEQYTYITVRSVIFKFIALIFMFFLVHKQTDYVIYGGITIFAASASNILNLINAHKFINLKPVGNYNFRRHLKPVLIFFAMSCATTIYTNLDTVMLGFMTTDTDVGYYNAAVKIKVILVSVVTSLGTVLLPRASYYIQRGELKEFHRITRKALNFVFLMATPLFVYFIYFAKEGIFFLSGNNYVGSIIPMQVIMPTLLLIGITNILGIQILVPTGREKIVLYSEIVGAVVDVIINALLIPVYASTGAAIGTLVAEFAVFVVQFYALKDEILNTFRQIHYIKILIALSVGSIVSLWVKILNLECFFSLVISSLLFFGAYGFVLLILKEELFLEIFNTIKNKII